MQYLPRRFRELQLPLQALSRGLRWLAVAAAVGFAAGAAFGQGDAKRGEYLARAGGCAGCHTDVAGGGKPFAGGRALETDFGTFYGPNITPDPTSGIGKWQEQDFVRAMREGMRPDGAHYYPSFPYTSFTLISDADLRDLFAYLRSLPPDAKSNRSHELKWPYRWRFVLAPWKWLFFKAGSFQPDPALNAAVNRGAYLTHALGHCGECHTARNFLGGLKRDRALAGARLPEGKVPNLTPTGIKRWSDAQLRQFLRTGATPEGDTTSDVMYEVIRNTTSQLAPQDLDALVTYLRSLPPLPDEAK